MSMKIFHRMENEEEKDDDISQFKVRMRTPEYSPHQTEKDTTTPLKEGASSPEDAPQDASESVYFSPQGLSHSLSSFSSSDSNFVANVESSKEEVCLAGAVKILKKEKKSVWEAPDTISKPCTRAVVAHLAAQKLASEGPSKKAKRSKLVEGFATRPFRGTQ